MEVFLGGDGNIGLCWFPEEDDDHGAQPPILCRRLSKGDDDAWLSRKDGGVRLRLRTGRFHITGPGSPIFPIYLIFIRVIRFCVGFFWPPAVLCPEPNRRHDRVTDEPAGLVRFLKHWYKQICSTHHHLPPSTQGEEDIIVLRFGEWVRSWRWSWGGGDLPNDLTIHLPFRKNKSQLSINLCLIQRF